MLDNWCGYLKSGVFGLEVEFMAVLGNVFPVFQFLDVLYSHFYFFWVLKKMDSNLSLEPISEQFHHSRVFFTGQI